VLELAALFRLRHARLARVVATLLCRAPPDSIRTLRLGLFFQHPVSHVSPRADLATTLRRALRHRHPGPMVHGCLPTARRASSSRRVEIPDSLAHRETRRRPHLPTRSRFHECLPSIFRRVELPLFVVLQPAAGTHPIWRRARRSTTRSPIIHLGTGTSPDTRRDRAPLHWSRWPDHPTRGEPPLCWAGPAPATQPIRRTTPSSSFYRHKLRRKRPRTSSTTPAGGEPWSRRPRG